MTLHSEPSHSKHQKHRPVVVAITGGSGAVYARRIVQVLTDLEIETHLAISDAGFQVLAHEFGMNLDSSGSADFSEFLELTDTQQQHCRFFSGNDYSAPMASGSFLSGGMVICPCSGSTLSAVANGTSGNLIQRAAEVHLKEDRKLILVPRETPLSLPTIENMRKAKLAGATILPASPGWYHGADSLQDIVDFIVARILDQLGIENQLMKRWGS